MHSKGPLSDLLFIIGYILVFPLLVVFDVMKKS